MLGGRHQIITKRGQAAHCRHLSGRHDRRAGLADNSGLYAALIAGATPVCVGKAANTAVDNPMLHGIF
jgi:hypothetical protein